MLSPTTPPPVLAEDDLEYEVEKILDSCIFCCKLQYKMKQKGYSIEDLSWEPSKNIHTLALIWEFYHAHPNALQAIWDIYLKAILLHALRCHTLKKGGVRGLPFPAHLSTF